LGCSNRARAEPHAQRRAHEVPQHHAHRGGEERREARAVEEPRAIVHRRLRAHRLRRGQADHRLHRAQHPHDGHSPGDRDGEAHVLRGGVKGHVGEAEVGAVELHEDVAEPGAARDAEERARADDHRAAVKRLGDGVDDGRAFHRFDQALRVAAADEDQPGLRQPPIVQRITRGLLITHRHDVTVRCAQFGIVREKRFAIRGIGIGRGHKRDG